MKTEPSAGEDWTGAISGGGCDGGGGVGLGGGEWVQIGAPLAAPTESAALWRGAGVVAGDVDVSDGLCSGQCVGRRCAASDPSPAGAITESPL